MPDFHPAPNHSRSHGLLYGSFAVAAGELRTYELFANTQIEGIRAHESKTG